MEFGYNDAIKKTIITELLDTFYGLGIDIKEINVDINTDTVNLKISLQS